MRTYLCFVLLVIIIELSIHKTTASCGKGCCNQITTTNNIVQEVEGDIDLCPTDGEINALLGVFGCCDPDPGYDLWVCGDGHVSGEFEVLYNIPVKKRDFDQFQYYTQISDVLMAFHFINETLKRDALPIDHFGRTDKKNNNNRIDMTKLIGNFRSPRDITNAFIKRDVPTTPTDFDGIIGSKLFFLPDALGAFRAGIVDQGCPTCMDYANIGLFSGGFGLNNFGTAPGTFVTGLSCNATSIAAVATGVSTNANGAFSVAMNVATNASNVGSFAINICTNASHEASTTMGISTSSVGMASLAIGVCNAVPPGLSPLFAIGNGVEGSGEGGCEGCNQTSNAFEVTTESVTSYEPTLIDNTLTITDLTYPTGGFGLSSLIFVVVNESAVVVPDTTGTIDGIPAVCPTDYVVLSVACGSFYTASPTLQVAVSSSSIADDMLSANCVYEVISVGEGDPLTIFTKIVCVHAL